MRTTRWIFTLLLPWLLAAPSATAADEAVGAQLDAMQTRLAELEARLDATTDELEHANRRVEQQEAVLESAGLAESHGASSALSEFVETVEIGGWVAASYYYNFNNPDGSLLGGANSGNGTAALYPFHPDANSLSLDQVWFEIERSVSDDNRAGFRLDMAYGKTAGILASGEGVDGFGGTSNDFDLYQAYVQYLAPIGPGVTFKLGKFGTVIGAEVAPTAYNFNISRGHVYNLFEPITHVGVLASTEFDGGLSLSLGLVNETRSFDAADIDLNKNKAALWSVGWGGEAVSLSFNGAYGSSDAGAGLNEPAGNKELILDWIVSWDPSDDLSMYVNADYIDTESRAGDTDGFGIAVAGRLGLTERLGLALRGEYATLETEGLGMASDSELDIWGLTGTLDYALTDKLVLRGELRYDDGDIDGMGIFFEEDGLGGDGDEDSQLTAAVEVIYSF